MSPNKIAKDILLVMSEQVTAHELQNTLLDLGYSVSQTVHSIEQFIEIAQNSSSDLALVELNSEINLNGIDAAKEHQNEITLPIVYISTKENLQKLNNARISEPHSYLIKPFTKTELKNAIENVIFRHTVVSKYRENEQWLSAILESIGEAVIVTDNKGNIIFMNAQAEKLLQQSSPDVKGIYHSEVYNIYNDDTSEKVEKTAVDFALQFGGLFTSCKNIYLLSENGTRIPIEDIASPIIDENDKTKGIVLVFRNIGKRKRAMNELIHSEEKWRSLVENAPDYICLINERGGILFINKSFPKNSTEEVVGKSISSFFSKSDQKKIKLALNTAFKDKKIGKFHCQYQVPNKPKIWLSGHISPLIKADQVENALLVMRDITIRKIAEEALIKSEERYAIAAEGSNDGLWDWDIRHNYVYYSTRWKEMLGLPGYKEMYTPDDWFIRIHEDDLEKFNRELTNHFNNKSSHFNCEYRILHADGEYRWVHSRGIAIRNKDGKPYRIAGSQADITKKKLYEKQLLHDAFHDGLTNLPNRDLFLDRLEGAINRFKRHKEYFFAVLFLDLDRFKIINDSLGHSAGDKLLVEVSIRLQKNLRKGDTIARFGGDEFTILLEGIKNIKDVNKIAKKIQKDISSPIKLDDNQEVFTSASIGIATSLSDYDSPHDFLRDADTAMYKAKSEGSGKHVLFNIEMHKKAERELKLERDLRRAIKNNEFVLYYQPIISLKTGVTTSLEALIRWVHPRRGLLAPLSFIPFAEETGLIQQIGHWVFQKACQECKKWIENSENKITVSVNLSALRFRDQDICEQVKETLNKTGLPPEYLELEITESKIMTHAEETIITLKRLKEIGVRLAIDDFGTGYSSLSYLKRFPLNRLKIDRTFVKDVTSNENDAAITKAIVAMAHNLNLTVIAEGIEDQFQLNFFKNIQCDFVQGYFFSLPLPLSELQLVLNSIKIQAI
jgi:diguanylate cyclase (GGDEF)-like protein/PAS domain S-box-containing protein